MIVPMLNQLLSTPPRSVIDVGCGVGAFLAEFSRFGVSDFLGVDGSWVPVGSLSISPDRFRALNLEQPLQIGRRFDLVICLEVAEHLEKISSDSIVKSLVNLAPVVLFSAAVPGQTGVNHLNCQWPDYWARKFRAYNYVPVDALRDRLTPNPDVASWYAQNTLLYIERSFLQTQRALLPYWDPTVARVPIKIRVMPHYAFAYRVMNALPPLPREWSYFWSLSLTERLRKFLSGGTHRR